MQTAKEIKIMVLAAAFMLLFPPVLGAGRNNLVVGEGQNGRGITLRVGETLRLELSEVGGTGYSWHLDNLDPRYLELVSQEASQVPPVGRVGGPVLEVWRFKAQRAGQTEINLDYYRAWEGRKTATKHFLLKIDILRGR